MKKIRKTLAVLLVLAMTLGLAACGSFETKMARAAKKMEKLQSYRMDMNLDMAFVLSLLGQSMDLDMGMEGTADVLLNPMRMKTDLSVSTMGENLQILSYSEKTDDAFVTYISPDGGSTWGRQSVDTDELPAFTGKENFALLFKLAGRFEQTGTETIRGSEATVFAGTVEGEDIRDLIEVSGMLDSMAEAMDVELQDLELNPEDFGGVPVTIAIDNKSGMIVRYTMDLTEPMQKLMPLVMDQVLAAVAEESGLEGIDLSALGLTLDVGRVYGTVELYDFDAVGAFEIPGEAREAPELSDIAA